MINIVILLFNSNDLTYTNNRIKNYNYTKNEIQTNFGVF